MSVQSNAVRFSSRRDAARASLACAASLLLVICAATVSTRAQAAVSTPFTLNNVALTNLATEVIYTVDFSTLPLRPKLIVEAVPDAAHANMSLQLTITNCNLDYPHPFATCDFTLPIVSTPKLGAQSAIFRPSTCGGLDITPPAYVGKTCDVKVKALGFGSAGAPATFNIVIRGETDVPTSTISANVTTASPTTSDFLQTSTSEFFDEGQNFRWIYDLDRDNVLVTPIAGRCEWEPPGGFLINLPYTYQFQGNPTYHGLDCCTWQIDSRTGVTGAGQAIFYVNIDGSIPANQPGDTDLDGIKNNCDNCPNKANGPLVGSCTHGPRTTQPCHSNQDCLNYACSLAQEDTDINGTGDACVPEPGLGALLGTGLVGLASLTRHRAIRRR